MSRPDINTVLAFLARLHEDVSAALAAEEPEAVFRGGRRDGVRGGFTHPQTLDGGAVLERASALLTRSRVDAWPDHAPGRSARAAGAPYDAASISVIVHPRNPFAPSAHANLRFFVSAGDGSDTAWWFGGGYDLTPAYGFERDARHWHETARRACEPFGADLYASFKKSCDEYFRLPHRNEMRGVGGLFFDDLDAPDFEHCFALVRSIGESFLDAYLPILRSRKAAPYGAREREFQLLRRGRYAEFNLLYDRGTRFGLAAGADPDSVLSSLPPAAAWGPPRQAEPGSPEDELVRRFLVPREWA